MPLSNLSMIEFGGSSFDVATASSDIDSMSNDIFGPVFAGGIAIMFAGVASALVVGTILDMNPDIYDDLVDAPYQDIKERKEKERMEQEAAESAAAQTVGGEGRENTIGSRKVENDDDFFSDYE